MLRPFDAVKLVKQLELIRGAERQGGDPGGSGEPWRALLPTGGITVETVSAARANDPKRRAEIRTINFPQWRRPLTSHHTSAFQTLNVGAFPRWGESPREPSSIFHPSLSVEC